MINKPDSKLLVRAAVGVQPPFSLIVTDGTTIAVKRQGSGPIILCLHAIGHGGRDYEAFADTWARRGHEVITLDWPGHGASPPDVSCQPVSAHRYATLLSALIPELCGDARPILVGNSIGGAAALEIALRNPDMIRALVLCNSGGLAPINALARGVISTMVAFFAAGARSASWFPAAFATYYRLVLPAKAATDQRARIVAAGREMAPLLKQAWESFKAPEADLRRQAQHIKVPVFCAWARHDQIVSWSRSKAAVATMRDARVDLFRGGHAAFLEDPETFNTSLEEFVNGLSAVGVGR